jgi:D-Ala-D-Ala ligase-like protein
VRLLVLGAGRGQLGLLAAARARGLFVVAVDRNPSAPGFRYADRRAILSLDDEPALERLAEAQRVHGVIAPALDWGVGTAARIAVRFGLPHPVSPETAVLASSKLRQRERFLQAGVPQTRWKLVTEPDDELGYPCVVKPPDRHDPRGLTLVHSPRELEPAVSAALRASRNRQCLIEEVTHGPEVKVTAFSRGGVFHPLATADRVPDGLAWPSNRGNALGVSPAELAARATRALGVLEGPTTTVVRLEPAGPRVVSLSASIGADHDAELCEAAVGIDLNALALAAALGEEIPAERLEENPRAGGACIRFLPGPFGETEGVEKAMRSAGVEWALTYRDPDRAGALLAIGATRDQALERAAAAADCIRFRTADEALA